MAAHSTQNMNKVGRSCDSTLSAPVPKTKKQLYAAVDFQLSVCSGSVTCVFVPLYHRNPELHFCIANRAQRTATDCDICALRQSEALLGLSMPPTA